MEGLNLVYFYLEYSHVNVSLIVGIIFVILLQMNLLILLLGKTKICECKNGIRSRVVTKIVYKLVC